jgi:hypothetical protein
MNKLYANICTLNDIMWFVLCHQLHCNVKLDQLCKQVKDNMCNSFLDFWNGERVDAIGSNRGKLDTYLYIKTHFSLVNSQTNFDGVFMYLKFGHKSITLSTNFTRIFSYKGQSTIECWNIYKLIILKFDSLYVR